jgi:hypothetical protein
MYSGIRLLSLGLLIVCGAVVIAADAPKSATPASWSMNATIIEACSCPMFCQCYFNTKPAAHAVAGHEGHGAQHFCRANLAYRVGKGSWGNVKLDGAKFWLSMDLGDDFSDGECEWVILTFDPSVTPEQRTGIQAIIPKVYPVKWKSFTVAPDLPIEWKATKDRAEARLDAGKAGEVLLNRFPGTTAEPVVINNLKYFGAPRNNGFVLMPNEIEAYRLGDKAFEYKGTNGFMITYDISDKDVMTAGTTKN